MSSIPSAPAKMQIEPGMGQGTLRGHTICHQAGSSHQGPECSWCPRGSEEEHSGEGGGFCCPAQGPGTQEQRGPLWGTGVGTEPGQSQWCSPAGLLPPPSLPCWPGLSYPHSSQGVLLSHTTAMHKKNEKTYQLTPLYQ